MQTDELASIMERLPSLSTTEQTALLEQLEQLEQQLVLKEARADFLAFCRHVYPDFKEGPHHRFMKPILHNVASGEETRVTISMPPRFGKSEMVSYLFVAWYLGHHPGDSVLMCTHTADLSALFGRKVRNLLDSGVYKELFPDTVISRDKSAANDWTTTLGGSYLAVGVGANIAGRGAVLCLVDDAVSEQSVLSGNPDTAFANAFEWLQVGPMQRLAPGGRIVLIGTRWGRKDPIGRALAWAASAVGAAQWYEVRFPAILPSGKSLWPEQWPLEELIKKKAALAPAHWQAQYMQLPTSEEGALIKREWWKLWPHEDPPKVEFVLSSWDTAHETKTSADYTACTLWGVWFNEAMQLNNMILLDAFKGRWEFPQLKKLVLEHYREKMPDTILVEKKAAGAPLLQELRAMGIPVSEFTPSRGNDKRTRVNAVSDLFFSGCVWAPDTRWAHEVMQEVAEFPNSEHDDFCFVGDTPVLRADGSETRIAQLRVGDLVVTPLGAQQVTAVACNGMREIWQLTAGEHTVFATANHKMMTQKGWKRIDELAVMLDSIVQAKHVPGLVSVVQNTHTTQLVYDITVENAHCFYANGLLAHNCDTVTQACLRYRQGGFIRVPSDEQDEPVAHRRHVEYY